MKDTIVLAKAILQGTDGKLLLVRRSKTDVRRPLQWDFPGGNVKDGEDFTRALIREVKEEVGILVKKADVKLAYSTTEMTEWGNISWLFYIGKTQQSAVTLSYEHDKYKWVDISEALQIITYDRQLKALRHIHDNQLFD